MWGAVRLSTHTARSLPAQTRHCLSASLLRLPEGQKNCCRASARVRCQAACAAAAAAAAPPPGRAGGINKIKSGGGASWMSWPSAGVSPTLRLSERREASLSAQSDVRVGERERERRRVDDASPAVQKVVATAAKPGPLLVPLRQSRSPSPGPRPALLRSSYPSCSPCGRPHGPPPPSRRQSRFAAGYSPAAATYTAIGAV